MEKLGFIGLSKKDISRMKATILREHPEYDQETAQAALTARIFETVTGEEVVDKLKKIKLDDLMKGIDALKVVRGPLKGIIKSKAKELKSIFTTLEP